MRWGGKWASFGSGDVEVLGHRPTFGLSQNGDAQCRKFAHFLGFTRPRHGHTWPHRRHSQASIFFIL